MPDHPNFLPATDLALEPLAIVQRHGCRFKIEVGGLTNIVVMFTVINRGNCPY
jgi:hypothetical protein